MTTEILKRYLNDAYLVRVGEDQVLVSAAHIEKVHDRLVKRREAMVAEIDKQIAHLQELQKAVATAKKMPISDWSPDDQAQKRFSNEALNGVLRGNIQPGQIIREQIQAEIQKRQEAAEKKARAEAKKRKGKKKAGG